MSLFKLIKAVQDLAKGQNGDWEKEGYTLKHAPNQWGNPLDHEFGGDDIQAFDRHGSHIGNVFFAGNGGGSGTITASVKIHPEHRRKGLASAMYQMAEKVSGRKMVPEKNEKGYTSHSKDAQALWAQPGRPFGKSSSVFSLISKAKSSLAKSAGWHVKIKGMDGYHPIKDIKDLGPGKGNNYILHDGREFHQDTIEDVDMGLGKIKKAGQSLKVWQSGLGSAEDRDKINPIPKKQRPQMIDHLASKTKTRPSRFGDGKKELLLHRGVDSGEFESSRDDLEGAVYHNPQGYKYSSWTTSRNTAESFAKDYDHGNNDPKVFSAWVHEDNIVHSPSFVNDEYPNEHEAIVRNGHYHYDFKEPKQNKVMGRKKP